MSQVHIYLSGICFNVERERGFRDPCYSYCDHGVGIHSITCILCKQLCS